MIIGQLQNVLAFTFFIQITLHTHLIIQHPSLLVGRVPSWARTRLRHSPTVISFLQTKEVVLSLLLTPRNKNIASKSLYCHIKRYQTTYTNRHELPTIMARQKKIMELSSNYCMVISIFIHIWTTNGIKSIFL